MMQGKQKLQRWSGVLGVIILLVSIAIAMLRAGLGLIDPRPISYLGVDPATATIFSVSLIVSALLFIIFGHYVKHAFRVNNRFRGYLVIGQIAQIIAAIVPYGSQSHYRLIHTIAGFTLAFSLPLLIQQFKLSQPNSPHIAAYSRLLRIEQLAFIVGIGLFVLTKGIAPLSEALPTIGFHLWILVVTITASSSVSHKCSKNFN